MDETFYSTKEVAEKLGVTTRTIRRLCEDRKIKFRQTTPRKIEIRADWLDEYLNSVTAVPVNLKNMNENQEEMNHE